MCTLLIAEVEHVTIRLRSKEPEFLKNYWKPVQKVHLQNEGSLFVLECTNKSRYIPKYNIIFFSDVHN